MSELLAADFTHRYERTQVQVRFQVPIHRFQVTVLFGPSGCGKSTTLRCLAGLERPQQGRIKFGDEIWFDDKLHRSLSPQQRDIGLMHQNYALFPHLTVAQNIAFGLRNLQPAHRRQRVQEMLERFQLCDVAEQRPQNTSGGQQQRTALARTLVRRPRLLLLDEPLSALDHVLRDTLRNNMLAWLIEANCPVIWVTHDRHEALMFADQLVVMDAGQVLQTGTVTEIYNRPVSREVSRITGSENLFYGQVEEVQAGLATVNANGIRLTTVAPAVGTQTVLVGVLAEHVLILKQRQEISARNQFAAIVQSIREEGPLLRIGLTASFELAALITPAACRELELAIGQTVTVAIKAPALKLIPRPSPTLHR